MRKDERGSIVAETLISFSLFALLCWCILAIIIMTTLQTRVHYALTQTAIELSVYAYVIEVLGFTETVGGIYEGHAAAGEMFSNIDTMITNLDIGGGMGLVGEIANDPTGFLTNVIQYVAVELSNEFIRQYFFNKYLALGNISADTYLANHRVAPGGAGFIAGMLGNDLIDFSGSRLIYNGNTKLVVRYSVDFTFGFLPLPENVRSIPITQSVMTRAWLGGYGEGFSP